MNAERMEMDVKEIILYHCKEIPGHRTPKGKETFSLEEELFTPSKFVFNELQFDIMALALVDYINHNHGGDNITEDN